MGRPSASYKREFDRNMKDARSESARRSESERPKFDRSKAAEKRQQMRDNIKGIFDVLEVGDSMQALGIYATVAKKNKKSVITSTGCKYTLREIGGQ